MLQTMIDLRSVALRWTSKAGNRELPHAPAGSTFQGSDRIQLYLLKSFQTILSIPSVVNCLDGLLTWLCVLYSYSVHRHCGKQFISSVKEVGAHILSAHRIHHGYGPTSFEITWHWNSEPTQTTQIYLRTQRRHTIVPANARIIGDTAQQAVLALSVPDTRKQYLTFNDIQVAFLQAGQTYLQFLKHDCQHNACAHPANPQFPYFLTTIIIVSARSPPHTHPLSTILPLCLLYPSDLLPLRCLI